MDPAALGTLTLGLNDARSEALEDARPTRRATHGRDECAARASRVRSPAPCAAWPMSWSRASIRLTGRPGDSPPRSAAPPSMEAALLVAVLADERHEHHRLHGPLGPVVTVALDHGQPLPFAVADGNHQPPAVAAHLLAERVRD